MQVAATSPRWVAKEDVPAAFLESEKVEYRKQAKELDLFGYDLVGLGSPIWMGAETPNLLGLKVSDTPFDAVRPYLGLGLDVLIGSEPLVREGMALGAVGAVSGLATAFPEIVSALVHDGSDDAHARVTHLRRTMDGVPFQAALKEILVVNGVIASVDVRAPLRGLTEAERERIRAAT